MLHNAALISWQGLQKLAKSKENEKEGETEYNIELIRTKQKECQI